MAMVGPSLGLRVYTATLTLASLAMAAFLFYTSTTSLLTSPLPSTYILHSELVGTSVVLALSVVAWHLLPLLSGGEFVPSKAEAEEGRCIRWWVGGCTVVQVRGGGGGGAAAAGPAGAAGRHGAAVVDCRPARGAL